MGKESSKKFLVIGVNWIGDAVMSLPALRMLREAHPDAAITLLTKPNLTAFWEMCPFIDGFQTLERVFPTIGKLRRERFDRAYVLPNSFRSAFLPFLAGVPQRIGARGHWRKLMLTETVSFGTGHQQFEAMSVLGVQGTPDSPALQVPEESFQTLERKLSHFPNMGKNMTVLFQALETCTATGGNGKPLGARPVITLLPGAARGPSKRWPVERFSRLAKNLCSSMKAVVLLGGGPDDIAVCKEILAEGYDIISLAGQTTLSEWAAMLQASDCVVSNDSGGMHLATAVGTPVVGLYGLTDPKKTGPLGENIILQKSSVQNRDVARNSEEAVRALSAICPEEVFDAVQTLLD